MGKGLIIMALLVSVFYFGSKVGDGFPWEDSRKVLLAEALCDSISGTKINLYDLIDPWGFDDYQAEIIWPTNLSYNGKLDTVVVFGSHKRLETYYNKSVLERNNIIFRRYDLKIKFEFYDKGLVYVSRNGSSSSVPDPKGVYSHTKAFAQKNWAIYVRAVEAYKKLLIKNKKQKTKKFLEKYFPEG